MPNTSMEMPSSGMDRVRGILSADPIAPPLGKRRTAPGGEDSLLQDAACFPWLESAGISVLTLRFQSLCRRDDLSRQSIQPQLVQDVCGGAARAIYGLKCSQRF